MPMQPDFCRITSTPAERSRWAADSSADAMAQEEGRRKASEATRRQPQTIGRKRVKEYCERKNQPSHQ
eukprot:8541455-Pyramimonas_sp.AAC.1